MQLIIHLPWPIVTNAAFLLSQDTLNKPHENTLIFKTILLSNSKVSSLKDVPGKSFHIATIFFFFFFLQVSNRDSIHLPQVSALPVACQACGSQQSWTKIHSQWCLRRWNSVKCPSCTTKPEEWTQTISTSLHIPSWDLPCFQNRAVKGG